MTCPAPIDVYAKPRDRWHLRLVGRFHPGELPEADLTRACNQAVRRTGSSPGMEGASRRNGKRSSCGRGGSSRSRGARWAGVGGVGRGERVKGLNYLPN